MLKQLKPKPDQMTLREKIGQTAVVKSLDLIAKENLKEFFECNPFGGFFLFDSKIAALFGLGNVPNICNSKDSATFVKKCNAASTIPLLVSADVESGAGALFEDLTEISNLMELGATNSEELAQEWGRCLGLELLSAGVNWAYSPTADLNLNRLTHVLNVRAISDNATLASKLLREVIEGIQSCGVAACAKHFPSQGNDARDAHIVMNVNNLSQEEWFHTQGAVYQTLIDAGVYSIMSSHIAIPAFQKNRTPDGDMIPTTASKEVITDLLKNHMGFEGVVVTDAIQMRGMTSIFEREESYIESLNAGNDIILLPDLDYIDIIEEAVKTGMVSMERIDDAVSRVLRLKEKLGMFEEDYIDFRQMSQDEIKEIRSIPGKVAENSLTLVMDKKNRLPFRKEEVNRVMIVCITHFEPAFQTLNVLKGAFEERGVEVDLRRHLSFKDDMKQIVNQYDIIIYAAFIGPFMPVGTPFFFNEEVMTLWQSMSYGKEKSVAVSFGSPYLYRDYFESAHMYVNAYSILPEVQRKFAAALLGEIPFRGVSPVAL